MVVVSPLVAVYPLVVVSPLVAVNPLVVVCPMVAMTYPYLTWRMGTT